MIDELGKPVEGERLVLVRAAFAALMAVDADARGLVMCWFCRGCGIYLAPGKYCHCENDE